MVFALSNPVPEIRPEVALTVRDDLIMATGRSDYPNQVNNVLGFPFIFRGALDVRASRINEEMQIAAVHALRDLTREAVPQSGAHRLRPGPTELRQGLHPAQAPRPAPARRGVSGGGPGRRCQRCRQDGMARALPGFLGRPLSLFVWEDTGPNARSGAAQAGTDGGMGQG